MPRPLTDAELRTVSPAVYRSLAEASEPERARLVLRLIEASPDGRLRLPGLEGFVTPLGNLDLSPRAVGKLAPGGDTHPAWWDAEHDRVRLQRAEMPQADLNDANLRLADLTGAHLRGSQFANAVLGGALFAEADLEEADLSGADLAGAVLRKAALNGANLQDTLLEEIDGRGASLRFARLERSALDNANLEGADLWGARLDGAVLAEANLCGARFHEASLVGADFSGADLTGADLRDANLEQARLTGANLRDTRLAGARLAGANLQGARLQDLDLTTCTLHGVHLNGAWMERTRIEQRQLGGSLGEERAGDFEGAAGAYLTLERNFEQFGNTEAASWAYRRRRRMEKQASWLRAREATAQGRYRDAARHYGAYARDQFVEYLCDYGESVPRALLSILVIYVTFTIVYGLTGSIIRIEDGATVGLDTSRDVMDAAIFSLISMTSSEGPAVGLEPRNQAVHVLTGLQTLLSIALTGLLGFVIGNRIRR